MTRDDTGAERASLRTLRDLGLLFFVAAALVAGLIHYSLARHDTTTTADTTGAATTGPPGVTDPASAAPTPPTSSGSPQASTSWTPSPSWAASTTPAPSGTTTTTTTTTGPRVTCWNGASAASLAACGRPTGSAGLHWVFPTLGQAGLSCHPAPRPAGDYRTTLGRECFGRVDGEPVTITFEQVDSQQQADEAIERSFAGGEKYTFKGARGGRCTWFDKTSHPARATGYYEGYPYVVSLYADSPSTVKAAWARLVRFRSPGEIRGLRE